MSRAASAIAVLGAALSAFVTASAFVNGVASGYGTPSAFYAIGFVLVGLGLVGATLALRELRGAGLALLVPAAVGFLFWPYIVPGAIALLAGLTFLAAQRERGSPVMRGLLVAGVLAAAVTCAGFLLGSFAYPVAGLIAVCCAFGSAIALLLRARADAAS